MFTSNLENDNTFSAFIVHQMELDDFVDQIAKRVWQGEEDINVDFDATASDIEYIKNRLYNKYNIVYII